MATVERHSVLRAFAVRSLDVSSYAVFCWLVVCLAAVACQRTLLYPIWTVPVLDDWKLPGVEKVAVRTSDGVVLKGYWRAPRAGGKVVVTFHGNGAAAESHASRFASRPWSVHGWGFLAVAYRGYPGSAGLPTEEGLMLDGEAAVAFAADKAPGAPMLFHGHSMGTGVAVAMAARHPSVGLYLEAPFSSMSDVVAARFPLLPTAFLWDTFRSEDVVCAVDAPLFGVHGADDVVISPALGVRLYRAMRQAGPTASTFQVVPGLDHVSVFGVFDREAEARFLNSGPVAPDPSRCLPFRV
jgi:pimeloyl-ACP methyl ester carboxylesterase